MHVLAAIGLCLAVFLSAFAYDFANVRYIQASAEGRRGASALWSMTVYAVGLVGLLGVIQLSLWLIIPEVLGLACGSYFSTGRR